MPLGNFRLNYTNRSAVTSNTRAITSGPLQAMPSLPYSLSGSAATRLGLLLFWLLSSSGCDRSAEPSTASTIVAPHATGKVIAQGQLLPADGIIQLFGLPGDPVAEIHVAVGEEVPAGKALASMRSGAMRAAQLATYEQQLLEAERTQANTVAAAQLELRAAELKLTQVESKQQSIERQADLLKLAEQQVIAAEQLVSQLERISNNALTQEFVGQIEVDRQRLSAGESRLNYQQQLETQRQAFEELEAARQVAQAELQAAHVQLTAAIDSQAVKIIQMQIVSLQLEVENSTITAPQAGKILTINATKGESGMQLPLMEMANLERLVCEVEVNEMDAAQVELQQSVIIRSRAFAEPLRGVVIHKSPLVGRPQLRPLDPLARVDYRAVTTLIELDAKSTLVGRDWLQLQVEVEIDTLRK